MFEDVIFFIWRQWTLLESFNWLIVSECASLGPSLISQVLAPAQHSPNLLQNYYKDQNIQRIENMGFPPCSHSFEEFFSYPHHGNEIFWIAGAGLPPEISSCVDVPLLTWLRIFLSESLVPSPISQTLVTLASLLSLPNANPESSFPDPSRFGCLQLLPTL